MEFRRFEPTLFQFLEDLAENNNRVWFQANKGRYEREVLEPAMGFIRAMRPGLKRISASFLASDQRVGGSLMRVYRDTRFGKDKTPYKTNVGIQFRHEAGRDVHAPGFYVHLAAEECFLALGLWRPDAESLKRVREAIVDQPDRWKRTVGERKFRQEYVLEGDSLKRPPRDFPADHPLVEDLKRTDFIGVCDLRRKDVLSKEFVERVTTSFASARGFMRFLCEALRVSY